MKRHLPIFGEGDGEGHGHSHGDGPRAPGPPTMPAPPLDPPAAEGPGRRDLFRLLGGTAALGMGLACYRPREEIVPYVRRPPGQRPGNPLHFATSHTLGGYGLGLVVRSNDGRPTKIEGNVAHPDSLGATGAQEQALLMGLYDEDRAKQLRRRGRPIALRQLMLDLGSLMQESAEAPGRGLVFLVEPTTSPTIADLRRRLLERHPQARFVAWAGDGEDNVQAGARLAFGRPLAPRLRLDRAEVIAAFDADLLSEGPAQPRLSRELASRRVPGKQAMSRLYVVEPALSLTGAIADHRLPARAGDVLPLLRALAAELARRPGLGALAPLGHALPGPLAAHGTWLRALAEDLARARRASLLVVGRRQPPVVHALAHAVNAALGAVGAALGFGAPVLLDADGGIGSLATLAGDLEGGRVDTLIITRWNPVYAAPADLRLGERIRNATTSLYLGLYEDETAAACTYFVPAAHPLESWGDARASDGTVSFVQPLIDPIWGGMRELELYGALLDEAYLGAHDLVRRTWLEELGARAGAAGDVESAWRTWLADGTIPDSATPAVAPGPVNTGAIGAALSAAAAAPEPALEIAFCLDRRVYDGRFANNAWLQELPDPITKLTWDNAALVSPGTAAEHDLRTGDVARVELGGRQVEAPILVQPAHVDGAITLALGYGRRDVERVATAVGFDVAPLRTRAAPWFAGGAQLRKLDRRHPLAITQAHFTMQGRDPALVGTLAELGDARSELHRTLEARQEPVATLYDPFRYEDAPYKWGMAIDLSRCTGCSACVVACQAENNTPVVGKEQVALSREMHWLRIDRYEVGRPEEGRLVPQPMMCQHCESAPCEYVCPVNATVHSDEGLNEMVYNRCIGTRYCSNNCPYKVRRFNYLNYSYGKSTVDDLRANPEVTVRSRGVMEKCTFCVQRIERARITSRNEGRRIADGEVQTACEQVCPAQAIVFGALNDAGGRVAAQHADPRHYQVLHELGTRPRTAYLAAVHNPNPALAPPSSRGHGEGEP